MPRSGGGGDDLKLWLTVDEVWKVIEDDGAEWGDLPAIERANFLEVCVPGLLDGTPAVADAAALIALEGFAEAYGALPCAGAVMQQPSAVVEAFVTIRQTRNMEKLREMRAREAEAERRADQTRSGARG